VLADVVDPNKVGSICYGSVGNHCDSAGFPTHIDLSKSNMKCDLGLVLSSFEDNNRIKSFEVRFLRLASENASGIAAPVFFRGLSSLGTKMESQVAQNVYRTRRVSYTAGLTNIAATCGNGILLVALFPTW
jgi:hypothetical protein